MLLKRHLLVLVLLKTKMLFIKLVGLQKKNPVIKKDDPKEFDDNV